MGMDSNGMNVNSTFFDALMHRTIDLHKFGGSLNKSLSQEITTLEHNIYRVLVGTGLDLKEPKRQRVKTRESINEMVDSLIYSRFSIIQNNFERLLNTIGKKEHDFILKELTNVSSQKPNTIPTGYLLQTLSEQLIAGKNVRAWGDNIRRVLRRNINTRINTEIAKGSRTEDVIKSLKGDKEHGFRNGVFKPALGKLQTLFRSGVTSVTNDIRQRIYSHNSHIIKGFNWNSALDGNSSIVCNHSHNHSWEVPSLNPQGDFPSYRSGIPHFNCRSTIVPIFRDESSVPQETENISIREWFQTRTDSEQRRIFGRQKYELWKENKISYPQLVNFKTTPITLQELDRRYGSKTNDLRPYQ